MKHYKPVHFDIKELVPYSIYRKYGQFAYQFIDPGLLHDLDVLREELGQMILVNGGGYSWSGLRTPEFSGYSPTSAHSMGKAVDIKLAGWRDKDFTKGTVHAVQAIIMRLVKEGRMKYITRMEMGTENWIHIDVFNAEPNDPCGLYLFNA